MEKDLTQWIHTSDGRIFIPKVRPQDIYMSQSNYAKQLIEINNADADNISIKINSIELKNNPEIYVGTTEGNKKVKAIYYGTGEINKLIWKE